jgi:DNA-binding NarL/FixJ family response regulator
MDDPGPTFEHETVTRVLIADDSRLVREALRSLIDSYADLRVIGEAKNGADAVSMAAQLRPDIVLMDFQMPLMDGSEAARTICRDFPNIKIVGMSLHPEAEGLMRPAGALAHVEKSQASTTLYAAVRKALADPRSENL